MKTKYSIKRGLIDVSII